MTPCEVVVSLQSCAFLQSPHHSDFVCISRQILHEAIQRWQYCAGLTEDAIGRDRPRTPKKEKLEFSTAPRDALNLDVPTTDAPILDDRLRLQSNFTA